MRSRILFYSLFCLFLSVSGAAQNTRIADNNQIGWYNYFGTFALGSKFSLHTEYQFRRTEFVSEWQQSLLRLGINYQIHPKVQLRLGYGWIETFSYGDFPINSMGKQFSEHRSFQMVTVTDKVNRFDLSHRFMLEQRWLGRYSNASLDKEDEFVYMNRLRYMVRLQMPLTKKELVDNTFYAAIYDELFVGFGENVNENVFDQNRLGLLIGYRFTKQFRLEGGYLLQTLQLAREVNGSNVFQQNQGLIVNAILNISK